MPIPQKVADLLARPAFAHASTRDASLTPAVHFTWGVRSATDLEHVEVLVPIPFVGPLRANVEDNKRFSLTIGDPRTHEAYQLKGNCIEVRTSNDDERAFQQGWAKKTLDYLASAVGMPPHHITTLGVVTSAPSMYLRFHVDEIYVQTPGPTAGQPCALD